MKKVHIFRTSMQRLKKHMSCTSTLNRFHVQVSLWWFENCGRFKFKLYLFYKDYETSYTTYINHARWHRCLRSDGVRVGGNQSARRKPTCLTWWPHYHLTCWRRVSHRWEASASRCASQTLAYVICILSLNSFKHMYK